MDRTAWEPLIASFRRWIEAEDRDAARMWHDRLNASDPAHVEGAIAEVLVWDFLASERLENPALGGSTSTGGPDFVFNDPRGRVFVEVTNMSREMVTTKTGLPHDRLSFQHFRPLTGQIKREVIGKAQQLEDTGTVQLVFVTTLHFAASAVCLDRAFVEHLLYSEPKITGRFDRDRGEAEGPAHESTDFELSVFTRKLGDRRVVTRRHMSGVLVGGFGLLPPQRQVLGVLHPDPLYPFDPELLVDVPCCRFTRWPPRSEVEVEWSQ